MINVSAWVSWIFWRRWYCCLLLVRGMPLCPSPVWMVRDELQRLPRMVDTVHSQQLNGQKTQEPSGFGVRFGFS